MAENSFQASVGGLERTLQLFPTNSKTIAKPNYSFSISLPGLGLIKIKINRNRDFQSSAIFTDSNEKIRMNQFPHKLFRGEVIMKSKSHPLAASVIYLKKLPYLILGFTATNPRSGKVSFYKVKISLIKNDIKSARIFRASRVSPQSLSHDQLVLAPEIKRIVPRFEDNLRESNTNKVQTIALSIDADSYWYGIYGEDSNSVIASFLNEAETIYENDLNLNFRIVRQNVFTNQTFGSDNAVDRLCNYQYYTTGESSLTSSGCLLTAEQGPQNYYGEANAYHLFTGQEMNTSTIGLAFVGTICSTPNYAFALTQLTSAATTPITFAHELAHNLSAIHDDSTGYNGTEVTSCPKAEPPSIMNPYISYEPADNFSACSKKLVKEHVALYGNCLNNPLVITNNPQTAVPEANKIDFHLKFLKSGLLTGKITLPSAEELKSAESCQLEIMVAKKARKLSLSPNRTIISALQSGFQIRFANNFAIQKNNLGIIPPVFFQSQIICNDTIITKSKVLKVATTPIHSSRAQSLNKLISRIPQQIILY